MIFCRVIHHVPGRIKIEIPSIKGLSEENLVQASKGLSVPEGIKNIRPNPFTGRVVITYEPEKINIMKYIKAMASNLEV
ncbi:hypothetical protein M1N66_04670 [Thermodesulfovibrionales bacterium]|nr:hypothetical protein [Thermodesulfovibrionales bacterium]MCL0035446.1 hypothetical protein [Thermodesulfovibrionales bacterium]MCL0085337.1 hypothetical protein [Thermodesulfovibrionales bacterium]MCL0096879.1 hypothetical protein [Thermodesulfovibrionales bacterium]